MRTAVHVDLAPDVRRPLEDHDDALLLGELNDLHRIRRRHHARAARRKAVPFGVVFRDVRRVVVVHGRRPRHERHVRLRTGAAATAAAPRLPHRGAAAAAATATAPRAARARRRRSRCGRPCSDVRHIPDASLAGNPAEVGCAIRQPRRRLGRSLLAATSLRLRHRRRRQERGDDRRRGRRSATTGSALWRTSSPYGVCP